MKLTDVCPFVLPSSFFRYGQGLSDSTQQLHLPPSGVHKSSTTISAFADSVPRSPLLDRRWDFGSLLCNRTPWDQASPPKCVIIPRPTSTSGRFLHQKPDWLTFRLHEIHWFRRMEEQGQVQYKRARNYVDDTRNQLPQTQTGGRREYDRELQDDARVHEIGEACKKYV